MIYENEKTAAYRAERAGVRGAVRGAVLCVRIPAGGKPACRRAVRKGGCIWNAPLIRAPASPARRMS